MVACARNRWTVVPAGEQAVLVSEAEVWLTGGILGRVASRLVARRIGRMGRRTPAAFTYFVEEGQAPGVKHSRLPIPAAVC
jgi:hypothetical protein